MDLKKVGKHHLVEIIPEYIVSEYAKHVIEENQLTGCHFRPVHDFKGRALGTYYQMVVDSVLPPLSSEVELEPFLNAGTCENCSLAGYLKSEFIYGKKAMEGAQDLNLTYEFLNAYRRRQLIVSSRVRNVFMKAKIRVYGYEPVRVLE